MQLKEFLDKTGIIVSDEVMVLCDDGIKIMQRAVDKAHSHPHIYRIFDDLHEFIDKEPGLKLNELNVEVLLAAICWHDVWRSERITSGVVYGTFILLWDGFGSSSQFSQRAVEIGFKSDFIDQVRYAIRKHSLFQLTKPKTLESQILNNLDWLELYSIPRIFEIEQTYLKTDSSSGKGFIQTLRLFLKYVLKSKSTKRMHFETLRKKLIKRREEFLVYATTYLDINKVAIEKIDNDSNINFQVEAPPAPSLEQK